LLIAYRLLYVFILCGLFFFFVNKKKNQKEKPFNAFSLFSTI